MKIMGWEDMCTKCQNLGRNPREKHTRCHDKSIKMQRCVYGREREASLKPIEILTGWAIARSAYGKTALVLDVRISLSTHFTLKIWNLGKICRKIIFPKSVLEHACIIHW